MKFRGLLLGAFSTLALAVSVGQAQATLMDGTWSGSASGAHPQIGAPDPVQFSATFSFDNASSDASTIAISAFTTNFGATSATFEHIQAFDQVLIDFILAPANLFVIFDTVSITPVLDTIFWIPAVGQNGAGYDTSTGSFTAAVPEPASLAIFGAGLAALGAMRRKRKAS